ncbi:pectinesterase family protein [Saccharicrinis sp. FJH62]|uniref:pectinesterase family protein n=1 Tax=Saccharicrinis sp. FJH62 TaxID=3344657 RepID=UPI0035D43D37
MKKYLHKISISALILLFSLTGISSVLAADVVAVNADGGNVLVDNVKEWYECVAKGSQLIDFAHDGCYITFDVQSSVSGYFVFTSAIATSSNNVRGALGIINSNGDFVNADTVDIANTGSWTSTQNYDWLFHLEAGVVYNFKMKGFVNSGYVFNVFTIKIAPFVADVSLKDMTVNGFTVIPDNDVFSTDAYYDQDLNITVTPSATTAEVSYTATCNDADIAISADGIISKSDFTIGDVVVVTARIMHGATDFADYKVTITINDLMKKQIRGTTENDGYWANVASSSLVQSWTDYIYTLTPADTSTRFGNGTWRPTGGSTLYGFYANNSLVSLSIPTNFNVASVSLIGYGTATFGLSSEGATITPLTSGTFDEAASADQLDEVKFSISDHVTGTPLNISVDKVYCRFYVVFSYKEEVDVNAPVLVDQNIENGEVLSGINGYISLRFNEAVKISETASATLNGNDAKLRSEDNVFIKHYYHGLEYSSNNTFVLKANSIEDMSGNKNESDITLTFSVGEKPVVTKKTFDFVVGVDGTIDEAITAANRASGTDRYYIFVPDGSYELTGNAGDHMTNLNRSRVSITGQSKDNSIITNTPDSYGISTTATIQLNGARHTYMQDITIKNNRGEAGQGQQVALYDRGSQNIFKNIKIFSFQDTYVSGDRAYWDSCDIYGSTDYICGGGDVFFDHCLMYNRAASGSKVTAPATDESLKWGYVFSHCTIDGGSFVLGRPWQHEPRAYYLYTKMNKQPDGTGWEGMSGLITHFYEYKSMDYSGNLLDLSGRGNSPTSTNTYTPILTDDEASEFTLYNVLGRDDGWMPSDFTQQTLAPEVSVSGSRISWTNDKDALCTVLFKDGVYFACVAENSYMLTENGTYTIQSANEMGGLGEASTVVVTSTGIELVKRENDMESGKIYDLMGRPLKQMPEEGFYIVNGKKFYKAPK